MCIVTVMNHGLRNGGGVGDILRKPSKDVSIPALPCPWASARQQLGPLHADHPTHFCECSLLPIPSQFL